MTTDRSDSRVALTNLVGVRVWLGDRWVLVHRDDVELIFGGFGNPGALDEPLAGRSDDGS